MIVWCFDAVEEYPACKKSCSNSYQKLTSRL